MENKKQKGNLFIVSGPSGVGKGTIVKALNKDDLNMEVSVSMTTRSPRPGEIPGVSYHFVDLEDFKKTIEEDGFMEYALYNDKGYGTPKKPVMDWLNEGKNVLLEIETVGAKQVMKKYPEAISVFITAPSAEELERRIRARATESEEDIQKRLKKGVEEMEEQVHYQHVICNNDLDQAIAQVSELIQEA